MESFEWVRAKGRLEDGYVVTLAFGGWPCEDAGSEGSSVLEDLDVIAESEREVIINRLS